MTDFVQGACVFAVGALFGVGVYILTPAVQANIRVAQTKENG